MDSSMYRVAIMQSCCRCTFELPSHSRMAVALSRCCRTTEITVRRLMFPKKCSMLQTTPTHFVLSSLLYRNKRFVVMHKVPMFIVIGSGGIDLWVGPSRGFSHQGIG